MYQRAERAEQILRDGDVWADVFPHDEAFIAVEINNGDWKHDHLRAGWLLESAGYTHISEVVTEEDGSDCYSAIHYFR
jgi:hypothetical protein